MEGFTSRDSENIPLIRDKLKVEKVTRASFGSVARKKLSDISNLQQQPRDFTQDEKFRFSSCTSKEHIDQLQKENTALLKMLADRNKIIELTGVEVQKLRINLQKMQLQNLQLAQSNSQMLAELNSGKDRLKALQHELGCKNGLLRAKVCRKEVRCKESEYLVELTIGEGDEDKQNHMKRKTKTLGPSRKVQSKDKAENKRACVRRQSARFNSEKAGSGEGSLEINDAKFSMTLQTTDLVLKEGSTPMSASVKDEVKEGNAASSSHVPPGFGRSSLGRPLRQAMKKIQCYKEIPVNIKMRRPD